MELVHQLFPGFDKFRVYRDAGNRTELNALGLIEMPHAFGTFGRIYLVDFLAQVDGIIRALRLAHITVDAVIGDHQCHWPNLFLRCGLADSCVKTRIIRFCALRVSP